MSTQDYLSVDAMRRAYGQFFSRGGQIAFDHGSVPETLRPIAHYAEFWGLSDDYDRDRLVKSAAVEVKQDLVRVVNSRERMFNDWLAGPEASSPQTLSAAYIAFSNLRIAADYADSILSRSSNIG